MEKLKFCFRFRFKIFKYLVFVKKLLPPGFKGFQILGVRKCFFVYGCETGAVSDKFLNGKVTNPVISQVCSPDTGDMFYMLHQRGEGGAMTLATL